MRLLLHIQYKVALLKLLLYFVLSAFSMATSVLSVGECDHIIGKILGMYVHNSVQVQWCGNNYWIQVANLYKKLMIPILRWKTCFLKHLNLFFKAFRIGQLLFERFRKIFRGSKSIKSSGTGNSGKPWDSSKKNKVFEKDRENIELFEKSIPRRTVPSLYVTYHFLSQKI